MDGKAHQLSPLEEQAIRSENVPPCSINAETGILVNESYRQNDLMRKVSVPYCNPALPCGGRRVFIIAVSQGFSLARSFRPNFPALVWREIWQPVVFITLIGTNLSRCRTKMKWDLKIDSGLMSAGSQECFKTDRYDTGIYSATVNISHSHIKYWFVPRKLANNNKTSNKADSLASLSFWWLIVMETKQ